MLAVVVALVPLILTPGLLYYFDATPKWIVLLLGTAIALPFLCSGPPRAGSGRRLFGLIALQAVSLTVSTLFSSRPGLSVWGSNWRNLGLISQGTLLLLALLIFSWLGGRPGRLRFMLQAIAVCGSLAAAYGILQYFGWDPWLPAKAYQAGEGIFTIVRPPGTMGHADYFANYVLFVIFAGAALAVNSRGAGRALGVSAAGLGTVAVVLSGTRGAWVGAAAGAVYLLLQLRPRFSRRAAILCVVVLVAAAGFYFSPAGFRLRSRMHWIGEDVRGGGRLLLWRDSLRLAARHWIVGAGLESFPALFPRFQSEELARAYPDFYYESPHNLFLDVFIAQGVFGLAVLLGWIALGLRSVRASTYAQYLGAALVAGVVGHMFSVFILTTALYFYVTVAMLASADAEPVTAPRRWLLAPVSAGMIFLALRMLAADRSLELARRDLESGRSVDAIAQYGIARARGLSADLWYARSIAPFAAQEALDAATRAAAGEDAQNAAYTIAWLHARTGDVHATEQSLRASITCSPNWYKPHWMLSQILQREGRAEEARSEAGRAIYLSAGRNPELDGTAPNR